MRHQKQGARADIIPVWVLVCLHQLLFESCSKSLIFGGVLKETRKQQNKETAGAGSVNWSWAHRKMWLLGRAGGDSTPAGVWEMVQLCHVLQPPCSSSSCSVSVQWFVFSCYLQLQLLLQQQGLAMGIPYVCCMARQCRQEHQKGHLVHRSRTGPWACFNCSCAPWEHPGKNPKCTLYPQKSCVLKELSADGLTLKYHFLFL